MNMVNGSANIMAIVCTAVIPVVPPAVIKAVAVIPSMTAQNARWTDEVSKFPFEDNPLITNAPESAEVMK